MVGREIQRRGDSAPSVPGVRSNGGESRRRIFAPGGGGGKWLVKSFSPILFFLNRNLKKPGELQLVSWGYQMVCGSNKHLRATVLRHSHRLVWLFLGTLELFLDEIFHYRGI